MRTFSGKPPFSRGNPEDWDPRLPWPAELIEEELEKLKLGIYITTHWIKVFAEPGDPDYLDGDGYAHLYDAGAFPFRASVDVEIDSGGVADVFYEKILWEKMDQETHDPEIRGHFAPMVLDALKILRKKNRRSVQRLEKIDTATKLLEKAVAQNKKAGYKPAP